MLSTVSLTCKFLEGKFKNDFVIPFLLKSTFIIIKFIFNYRNSEISCDLHSKLDVSSWEEKPSSTLPDDLVMQAVHRAEADVAARRNEEYNRWSQGN